MTKYVFVVKEAMFCKLRIIRDIRLCAREEHLPIIGNN